MCMFVEQVYLQMWWLPHFQGAKSLVCTIPRMKRKASNALLHPDQQCSDQQILTKNYLQSQQWCPYCPSNGASTRGEEWVLHPFVLNRVRNGQPVPTKARHVMTVFAHLPLSHLFCQHKNWLRQLITCSQSQAMTSSVKWLSDNVIIWMEIKLWGGREKEGERC